MSLVREAIQSVAKSGEIEHECKVNGVDFILRPLSGEEQFLSDGIIGAKRIKEKYGADDVMTMQDTLQKYRSISMIGLSVKKVNGKSPVEEDGTLHQQFEQRLELIDELMELPSAALDELNKEYNKMNTQQRNFYRDIEDNVEKS